MSARNHQSPERHHWQSGVGLQGRIAQLPVTSAAGHRGADATTWSLAGEATGEEAQKWMTMEEEPGAYWQTQVDLHLLVPTCFCRFGEASNPGPSSDAMGNGVLHLGACNPSGLARKSQSFLDLPFGIYGVAETQLTQPTFHTFSKELAFHARHQQRDLRLVHGAYAPNRPGSCTGAWTGVAFVSDVTPRKFQLPWRSCEYSSGRVLCSSFVGGQNHLLGASVYIPPSGPTYGTTTKIANELLAVLTQDLICGSSGYRFVLGDFNRDPQALRTFDIWRQAGWEEVQILFEKRDARERVPTSKGAAFSDHIWLSPELAATLTKVEVFDEVFAEHDVVIAALKLPNCKIPQFHWPKPAPIPWDELPKMTFDTTLAFDEDAFVDDPSRFFAKWSAATERQVIDACPVDTQLPRGLAGRGQIREVHKREFTLLPLHPSRQGEETLRSDLLNRSVHYWFEQLRRLQAYSTRAKVVLAKPRLQVDQACTWNKIMHAPGFKGGFRRWWMTRPHQLSGSPGCLPEYPPSAAMSWAIFVDFRANFRHYEQWELRRRHQVLQAKAFDHNKMLYRQLRDVDMSPPDHFTINFHTLIATVEQEDEAELTDEITLPEHSKWFLNEELVKLQVLSSTRVKIDSDLILVPGQRLRGQLVLAQFQDMEQALASLWKPLWNRHMDLGQETWQRAISFAQVYMPRLPFGDYTWSASSVGIRAGKYKKKAATGPDGWSREDIQMLPESARADIASLLLTVQRTGAWPQQLVTGIVCPARKHSAAETPGEFRPIILLSFLYRLWASVASKVLLNGLITGVGNHTYGFVTGRRPQDLWYLVQLLVECSYHTEVDVSGINLDLVKCFNNLPRTPIFESLRIMGAPDNVLVPWKGGLHQLERRFRISTNMGPAYRSTVGYPEGDPLSCVGMLAFNMLMETYMNQYEATAFLTSFVDNLQLMGSSAAEVQRGFLTAQVFFSLMDLQLDDRKCYAWPTSSTERAALRSAGHTVKLHAKDLGAQMAFARTLRSTTTEERIHSISHFWPLLQRSSAPVWFKLQAIRVAAWPKAMHGCENKKASLSTTSTLRSKAMLSLNWRRAGATPWVRWALQQSYDLDPEFFQLWCILRSFLRFTQTVALVVEQWQTFCAHPPLHGQGPFHSVQQALEVLGWTWLGDLTLFVGQWIFPRESLHETLLRRLLEYSWDDFVVRQLSTRSDFQGLDSVSRRLSFTQPGLTVADQSLLATIQDGTFFTAWQKSKFDASHAPFCDICNQEDDLEHRCRFCPKYNQIRNYFKDSITHWNLGTPAFNLHGLVERNPYLVPWMTYLCSLPDRTRDYTYLPCNDITYDLFVDGSCERRLGCVWSHFFLCYS